MPNFKKNTSPFMMKGFSGFGNSPLKQHYPSSAQTGPHGSKGTLDEVKRIASSKTKTKTVPKAFTHMKSKDLSKFQTTAKTLTKKSKTKIAKKVLGKAASRLIPGAGWALAAHDVYSVGKKMTGGHSFKDALKSHYLGIEE